VPPRRSTTATAQRALLLLCVLVGLWLAPHPALAWLDLRVVSDVATVEVSTDGASRVRHEMVLRVRGGPLRSFTLDGIDGDATPVPGATIVLAKSGRAAGIPSALRLQRDQELLTIDVVFEKGLPTGTYLVDFGYTTDLRATGALKTTNEGYALSWKSPRFSDGIGSLKARFVTLHGEDAPALALKASDGQVEGGTNLFATEHGVYLSEARREGDRDVLELTRPHAARGEQVTWPVRFGPAVQEGKATKEAAAGVPGRRFTPRPPSERSRLLLWAGVGLAAGVGFTGLVGFKRRLLSRQRETGGAVTFLLPMGGFVRFLAISSGIALSVWLAFGLERATWAGLVLFVALLFSIQHAVPERQGPRGPGTWARVEPEKVFTGRPRLRGAGTLLEASTVSGFVCFVVVETVTAVFALRTIGTEPYRSAALATLLAVWVPLFWTLGGARLTLPRRRLEPSALEPYFTLLAKRGLSIELIARTAANADPPERADEHRIRFLLPDAAAGFDSLELALEWMHGGWFLSTRPVFIVRTREGSPAHEALPRQAVWSRGRHRDERIALLRPNTAWPEASLLLARELLHRLERRPRPVVDTAQPKRSNAPRSENRAKAATREAPEAPLAAAHRG
jgi:hypothetical protein